MTHPLSPRQIAKLFPCQREALKTIERYLATEGTQESALIQMPMGSGKSGLIAISSNCFPSFRNILVVSPAEYLCRQLEDAVKSKFWRDSGIRIPESDIKKTQIFTPKNLQVSRGSKPIVYVCTAQSLLLLYLSDRQRYEDLKKQVQLLLFDEGHREPAAQWAKSVRGLNCKTILFSATPYRNDFRRFKVSESFRYAFHYQAAQDAHIIRDVHFDTYEPSNGLDGFIKKLFASLNQSKRAFKFSPKVLVRCASAGQVRGIVSRLNSHTPGCAMGFHSTFGRGEASLKARIPDLAEIDPAVRFFVHENMLIEGIDDSRFVVLGVHGRMTNARQLIQQIGRVIRNHARKSSETATILVPRPSRYEAWWENYLRAELDPTNWSYLYGEFREAFDPTDSDFVDRLLFPLSAILYECDEKDACRDLVEAIHEELEEQDVTRVNLYEGDSESVTVSIYSKDDQVNFVRDGVYTESRLGYFVLRWCSGLLFFYDSNGFRPEILDQSYERVDPSRLQRLFHPREGRFTYVNLANCDVSQASVRQRTASAYSVAESLKSLNDHFHYCTAVRGMPALPFGAGRRYIGFTRSRVSDAFKGELRDFMNWSEKIGQRLDEAVEKSSFFKRYAELVEPPKDPVPTSILLDLDDVIDDIVDSQGKNIKSVGELCSNIDEGKFLLSVDGTQLEVGIQRDPDRPRFLLECEALHTAYRVQTSARARSLLSYLNQEQCFRLTLLRSSFLYSNGFFFRPRWRLSSIDKESEVPMHETFFMSGAVEGATSEKGIASARNHRGWRNDSLFGAIDHATDQGTDPFPRLTSLVCDDLNREICDFVGFNRNGKRVAFIHAKYDYGNGLSGSFFHDICGQAKKNLDYVHRYAGGKPPNLHLWDGRWPGAKGWAEDDYVTHRIRRPRGKTGAEFWEDVRTLIEDPYSQIEVWMVLGGFSFSRYFSELRKESPAPQVIQIAYLLQSTLDAVTQLGARLRIFCER